MQEVVEEKTVALTMKGTKITGRMLAQAMRAFLRMARKTKGKPAKQAKQGMQSLKSLRKEGASLSNIEISDMNIGSFKKTARKFNVDFALKCDKSIAPPKWLVFFKAKDADALTAAFNEYSSKILKTKTRKPSILKKLGKFMELAKKLATPVKSRSKGGHEL